MTKETFIRQYMYVLNSVYCSVFDKVKFSWRLQLYLATILFIVYCCVMEVFTFHWRINQRESRLFALSSYVDTSDEGAD